MSGDLLSLEIAQIVEEEISLYTLHLHENGHMNDDSNFCYIEQQIDGNWEEVDFD